MRRAIPAMIAIALTLVHPAAAADCALTARPSDSLSTATCLACHGSLSPHGHPVDVSYAQAQAFSRGSLRSLTEVVRRGVFLPGGRVECTTCHDARSPWADHIALPPGSAARSAIDTRNPATYENRPNWRVPATGREVPPLPGSAVSSAPLCAACHATAD